MGFGMDGEAYRTTRHLKNSHLCSSDAAGGLAVRKSPRGSASDDSLRSKSSRLEIKNDHGLDEVSSIGSLSIEPGLGVSSTSTASTGSVGYKSLRSFRSLNFRISKEDMRKDVRNFGLDDMFSDQQDDTLTGSKVEVDGLRFTSVESPILLESTAEKDMLSAPNRIPSRASSRRVSIIKEGLDPQPDESKGSSGCAGSPRQIPTRDSSLRRSYGGNSSHRNRRSYWSDHSGPQVTEKLSFDNSRDSPTPHFKEAVDNIVEDDVSRRIKELKDQKRLRDHTITITTSELVTRRAPEPSCTPSPLPQVEVILFETLDDKSQVSPAHEAEKSGKDETTESSAPSPAIMQRINRNISSPVNSMPSRITTTKSFPLIRHNTEPRAVTAVPPQRSNSRLLRRLSRPASPSNPEKHKRTFSNPLVDERPKSVDSIDHAVDDYLSSSKLSQKIKHPQTGRLISFSEVGDPNGSTIFCCVGMGLTRYITAFYDELASTLKLRLITPDRPGVGGSEPHTDGSDTPLGWPGNISL